MNDLISIVLPVYNGEKYLRESIDSILKQTYENWELLILDDCSTDSSSEIAKEYEQKDQRIHYYRNEHNLRLPGNLNRGFSLAKGNYLTWTSDDNRYRPMALEKMYLALHQNPDAQFAFASCRIINGQGEEIEYLMVSPKGKKSIVGSNCVGACFLYTRKAYETVGDYDAEYTLVEDFDYWQRIAAQFETVAIEEILYDYRWHDGALTSTMKQEVFQTTLEKMLLKNRSAFGKLDAEESYYYYTGLHNCREKLSKKDPDQIAYVLYKTLYFFSHRVPGKIRRMLKNN